MTEPISDEDIYEVIGDEGSLSDARAILRLAAERANDVVNAYGWPAKGDGLGEKIRRVLTGGGE